MGRVPGVKTPRLRAPVPLGQNLVFDERGVWVLPF